MAGRRTNIDIATGVFAAVVDGPFTLAGLIEKAEIIGSDRYRTAFRWIEAMYHGRLIYIAEWRRLAPTVWRSAWVPAPAGGGRKRVVLGRWEPVYAFGAGDDALPPE